MMASPPASPPKSDMGGVHRDRRPQTDTGKTDAATQAQCDADARESIGRPARGDAPGRS